MKRGIAQDYPLFTGPIPVEAVDSTPERHAAHFIYNSRSSSGIRKGRVCLPFYRDRDPEADTADCP